MYFVNHTASVWNDYQCCLFEEVSVWCVMTDSGVCVYVRVVLLLRCGESKEVDIYTVDSGY